mmetsp:Transcript_123745/g.174417  ORF Transcript_123745/g.174417 Transcript_123745/m.174417 type:complete len:161 (-) Transcript_123745:59-541(-)
MEVIEHNGNPTASKPVNLDDLDAVQIKLRNSEGSGGLRGHRIKFTDYLKSFLDAHGFSGVNAARALGWFFRREHVYPLHIAAQHGDAQLVEILLEAGADPDSRTSKGRTALDFALNANVCNSHSKIISMLQAHVVSSAIDREKSGRKVTSKHKKCFLGEC